LKAISIKQPYANQIISGEKTVEYRSWTTKHRGDLLICASKSPEIDGLPVGKSICIAELWRIELSANGEDFKWHLRNIRPVRQIPVRGMPGLFNVDI
jgi:hypothetical protein